MNFIKYIKVLFLFIIITSCCEPDYDKKDFEFSEEELSYLSMYNVNERFVFKSNLGNIHEIIIRKIDTERKEGGSCFLQVNPSHIKTIRIEHFPIDKWKSVCFNCGKYGNKTISYQSLINISAEPLSGVKGYGVFYRDFYGNCDSVFDRKTRQYVLNGDTINNCYKIIHSNPKEIENSSDIEVVYWTKEYGLTAYTSKEGETWLIER